MNSTHKGNKADGKKKREDSLERFRDYNLSRTARHKRNGRIMMGVLIVVAVALAAFIVSAHLFGL